jgi:class 3 adenylate cyclase
LLEEFLSTCYKQVTHIFAGAFIKPLGDGAMIIQECPIPQTPEALTALLDDVLQKICTMEVFFRTTCAQFKLQCGEETSLRLGWGITRGFVTLLTPESAQGVTDYLSSDINKCAKLCKEAFPAGIVIDEVDFPDCPALPGAPEYQSFAGTQRAFERRIILINRMATAIPVWASLANETLDTPHKE